MSNAIYIISSIEQLGGFNGHLAFLALFAIFVIIHISWIYFSYIYAFKKNLRLTPKKKYEIPEQGKKFHVKKGATVTLGILVLVSPFVIMHYLILLKNESGYSGALWLLIDFLILAFVVFSLLLIKSLRSYIYINQDGIECRRIIGKKSYHAEDIELVLESPDFLFIKLKSCKFPIILETTYADYVHLLQMLRSFNNPLTNYHQHNDNLP